MLLFIYKILTYIIYMLIFPFGYMKYKKGDLLWRGRLGLIEKSTEKTLWIHAASVGEVKVIGNLLNYLEIKNFDRKIHLTVVTSNGYGTAKDLYGDKIDISYFPLDALPAVRGTIEKLNPYMVVIAETEIWFNLINEIGNQNIPLILINGRMTENSFGKYNMIKGTMCHLFESYHRIFFKSGPDSKRFFDLGFPADRAEIAGDMKFDFPLKLVSEGRKNELRHRLSALENMFLLTAVSTRPPEEEILISLYKRVKEMHASFKLLIAPRHLERLKEICALLRKENLPYSLYSEAQNKEDIIVVDKMGVMGDIFPASNLAFVGGTLTDLGGHNILEPVWFGVPVIFGNSVYNVKDSSEYLQSNNFGLMVNTEKELIEKVIEIIEGKISFHKKTEHLSEKSASSIIGNYIIGNFENA